MRGLLDARKVSCVELMQQTFADIKSRDTFNSFITRTEERALAQAAERDAELASGIDRGVFHGIPIAYKDIFYTRGVRTTGGSLPYRNFVPEYDATVVTQLHDAGAISVGKTNLHELAYGVTSNNPHYGPVLNPRDTTRIPGGSSGGSASLVAAGLIPMSLGTDTGGSIRIPASYCGIVGLKPTYGTVSRHGVMPLAFSLDHVGPLTSCVEDCALTMQAVAPGITFTYDPLPNLSGVRVGVPANFFFDRIASGVEESVRNAVEVMRNAGATIVEIAVPNLAEVNVACLIVQLVEACSIYVNFQDPSEFGENFWSLIKQGEMIAGHEYVNAQRLRTVFGRQMGALWQTIDVLVAPTTPVTAPPRNATTLQIGSVEEDVRMASTRLVRAMNFFGLPALSMPCGNDAEGLPIGLQLISAAYTEGRLLQIAGKVESLLN